MTLGALGLVGLGRDLTHSPVLVLQVGGVLEVAIGVVLIVVTGIGAARTVLARARPSPPRADR
ncbi:MAG TPA: hypothetical protein VHO27_14040 [Angustibacter sp.]|nr:hypothetical protein [Angustibacter sp.]